MAGELVQRQDVAQQDCWNVQALYPTDEAWETAFAAAQRLPGLVETYQGRLAE
jgi:hypothetical protein